MRVAVFTAGIFGIFVGAVSSSGCGRGETPVPETKRVESASIVQKPDEVEIKNIVGIERTQSSYSIYTYDPASKVLQRFQLTAHGPSNEIIVCDVEKGAPMWAKQYYKKDGRSIHSFELHVTTPGDILNAEQR